MDRSNTFLHAMPVAPLADSNVWRVTIQWHDHVFWQRFDVHDTKARAQFIREWCEKIDVDMDYGLWIYGAIDQEVGDWLKRSDEIKDLNERLAAMAAQVETMEREWSGMKEKYEDMKKWVLTKLKGNGNGNQA
jgi:chaperonin cofactor prefoldin